MPCSCTSEINKQLRKHGQTLNANMFGEREALISLVRTDFYKLENRKSKQNFMIASFCPFCGAKYASEQVEAA